CKSGSAQHRRPRRRALAYRNRPSKDPLEKNPLAMEEIIFLTKGKQGPDLETASNHVNLAGVQQADPGKDPYDQDALSRAGQDVLRQQGKPKYRSFLSNVLRWMPRIAADLPRSWLCASSTEDVVLLEFGQRHPAS